MRFLSVARVLTWQMAERLLAPSLISYLRETKISNKICVVIAREHSRGGVWIIKWANVRWDGLMAVIETPTVLLHQRIAHHRKIWCRLCVCWILEATVHTLSALSYRIVLNKCSCFNTCNPQALPNNLHPSIDKIDPIMWKWVKNGWKCLKNISVFIWAPWSRVSVNVQE